jgi:hypothetical protein
MIQTGIYAVRFFILSNVWVGWRSLFTRHVYDAILMVLNEQVLLL